MAAFTSRGKILRVGKIIALLVSGIAVGFVLTSWWGALRPSSQLTEGLPSVFADASTEFDARVRARFPLGISVWKLADELQAEGFNPTWFEPTGEYGAKRTEDSFVCNIAARVYWRLAGNGTLSSVRGVYGEEGCL